MIDDELIDKIREDSDLFPAEKETIIRFAKDEDKAHVFTENGGIARRLHAHPDADVEVVRWVDGHPVGATGTIPVNYIVVKGTPRNSASQSAAFPRRSFWE